jgi:hypothetical protein
LNTAIGLSVGVVSEKLFVNISRNPVKKLLGTVLMFGITNVVTKHPDLVKSIGLSLLKMIRNKWTGKPKGALNNEIW